MDELGYPLLPLDLKYGYFTCLYIAEGIFLMS